MTHVVEVSTLEELESLILNETYLVIDFAAPAWCVPCKRLAPHYEKAAEVLQDVKFVHIDIDTADPEIKEEFLVQSVPTVIAYIGDAADSVEIVARAAMPLVREIQGLIDDNNASRS